MRKRNKWLSGVLASTMVLSQVATSVPMTAFAAPNKVVAENATQRAVTEVWRHFKSSAQNDNGANAAILVNTNANTAGMTAGEMSFVLKNAKSSAETRFNVGPYITSNGSYVTVGFNANGWFYEYKGSGNDWPTINGLPTPPGAGEQANITIKWNGPKYTVTVNGQSASFEIPQAAFDGLKTGKLGFRIGSFGTEVTDISFKDVEIKDGQGNVVVAKGQDTWKLQTSRGEVYEPGVAVTKVTVSGKVVDEAGKAVAGAEVALGTATTTTKADGTYTFENVVSGDYNVSATKRGYQAGTKAVKVDKADVTVADIVLKAGAGITFESDEVLSTGKMDVAISNKFPQVFGYTMKGGELEGKKFYGQTDRLTQIKINNVLVTPKVTFTKESATKALYTMVVNEQGINATLKAVLEAKDNTLSFNITEITGENVFTIDIPNHNLVTAKANQTGASFAGANMSVNVAKNGDTYSSVSGMANGKKGYMYAFVSTDELSAGLWSNSENNVTADWQRVTAVTATKNGVKETGLSSTYWTYQKTAKHRKENKPYEMPATKVVITGDQNEDKAIDWQDGAVAYRTIMNNPVGAELVPDRVAIRVAMNFNSHAQNPFLMTYDNAQKVYLNTDGLGQSILLKGYGSEGHDSGHLNYADVGKRIGGVDEMKKLLAQGKEIGATFGIHVNASETYPESIYFTEDRLKKDANGNLSFGWNWLDQGVNINADYDLRNGREQRFVDLYNALGGKNNDLDFIYVDVWGNGQSGDNGTWASRQLAKEITQTCGWRLGSEWGYANEYDSTFQHWAADLTYGGAALKGINSYITRFIRNHQKDSWVGDYPSYGAGAIEPLLGGYDMKDFEGWQGRNDYKGYIQNLFDDNLSTKFIQHYKVVKWVNGEETTVGGAKWVPEKEITLKDDANNKVVITRKSTNGASADYRHRTMTYNGRVVMDGEKYLIPWFWDANGKKLAAQDEKLYHWNQAGGTSTWDLPAGWEGAELYELTETGKIARNNLATIQGGKITINAQGSVPYVLHKAGAGEGIKATDLTWSQGSHLIDTGFNSNTLAHWTTKGNGSKIVWSAANNMMLEMGSDTEEVSLTQTVTDLVPGKGYAAYVGVDNRSDAKAYIEVTVDGKVISNYTERSIAKNYLQSYAHNTNNATTQGTGSYFQNMYVFFTAPAAGKEVKLTLKRAPGAGKTYFDDVRVVNNMFGETETDGNFNPFVSANKLHQTFEAVPQGLFPFVIGNVEGVTDNRTHLSELHAPYTQSGWYNGVKKLDDVLTGNWSVKTNGLSGRGRLVYQTIPQNFRFEEGVTYNISFKYEMGSEGTYQFAVGDGESNGSNFDVYNLEKANLDNAEPKTFKFRLTGKPGNKSWIGIYSTRTGADTMGTSGGAADFGGYKDFVLDDLVIEKSKAQKAALENLVAANSGRHSVNYTAASWKKFDDAMKAANAALDNFEAEQAVVDAAKAELEKAVAALDVIAITLSGKATDAAGTALANIDITVDNGNGKSVTTKTDKSGNYVLPGVLFGERSVVAESNVFATNTKKITAAKENLEVTVNFQMAVETVTVEGQVTAVGEPVEGATVTFGNKTATTNATGHYTIAGVPTKAYAAKAAKDGYEQVSKDVLVVKGQKAVVNFMLPPRSLQDADYENNYDDNVKTWDNLAGNTASTAIAMENGQTKISFPGGHTNVYETLAPEFKNGVVEMDITSEQAGTRIGILLRAKDMNNRVYVGVGDQANQYFAEHWGKGGNSWTGMHSGPTFAANTKMHLKAEIVDTTVKLWVNGQHVLTETMSGMPKEAGCLGLNTRATHTVRVDNVKVTSYDVPTGNIQTVAGRVVGEKDAPIANAAVVLTDNNGKVIKETVTDALGNYKFKNIVYGEYQVKVTANNLTKQIPVTVGAVEDGYVVVPKAVMVDVPDTDKTGLAAAIKYAEEQMAAPTYPNVIPAVRTEYEAAYNEAKTVFEDAKATQTAIDAAKDKLVKVGHKLGWYKGDLTELQAAYDQFNGKDLSVYTEATRKALETALKEAKEILDLGENAVKVLVDDALAKLNDAISKLQVIPVDKSRLEKLVKEAKQYEDKIAEYTPATGKSFTEMLAAAREVLATEVVKQETIDSAYVALNQAILDLRKLPNKDELKAMINTVEKMDLNKYTAESAKAVQDALAAAKAVYANEEATQKEVDDALAKLDKAVKGLEESSTGQGGNTEKPGKPSKPGTDKPGTDKPGTNKPAQTGDAAPVAAWGVIMLAGLAAVVAFFSRRRRSH